MLSQRLIFGSLMILGLTGLLLLDGWLSERVLAATAAGNPYPDLQHWLFNGAIGTAITLLFTWLCTRELLTFAYKRGFEPPRVLAQVFSVGLVVGPYIAHNVDPARGLREESWGMLWLALALGLGFFLQALRRGTKNVMPNLSSLVFIVFYAGGLAGFLVKLRMEIGGNLGILVMLATLLIVKSSDIGAYFSGMLLGRHKMIPWLSPKKTWEGFVGGILISSFVAIGIVYALGLNDDIASRQIASFPGFPINVGLVGLLLALIAVAGDLCASLLKRDAELKDSSQAIPGFGGVLDVMDSPLLTAPVAWFLWTRVLLAA
ncbi:MAG: phosphatidate cytidylyltransferase [Phycisphaerae bacterium]